MPVTNNLYKLAFALAIFTFSIISPKA